MSHSDNSSANAPKAEKHREQNAAGAMSESQGIEQMAFFETAPALAADSADVSAPLADDVTETAASATQEPTEPSAQTALFPESLAQRLVAARDARGWSRDQVAAKLHLPLHIVQWIETEQYDRVGQGVYLRGYLNNYARLVGVPVDAVDQVLRAKAPPPPELVATGRISHSRYLVERYSGSALYLVLTGVIFVPLVMFAMNMGGNVGSRLTPLDAPAAALASADTDANGSPSTSSTAASSANSVDTQPATPAAAATPHSDSPLMASFTMVPTLPAAADQAKQTATTASIGQLRLRLAEASWVEIVDADGKRLEYSTLPAGTVKEYPAEKSLTILLGNTGGAKVEVDGQTQDITPYNRGNVARFKLGAGSKSIGSAASESHNG
jgi:cytoskeleton protein RodZ